jgi:hypothetical protein
MDNAHLLEVLQKKIHTIEGIYDTTSTIYYDVRKWASHTIEPWTKD